MESSSWAWAAWHPLVDTSFGPVLFVFDRCPIGLCHCRLGGPPSRFQNRACGSMSVDIRIYYHCFFLIIALCFTRNEHCSSRKADSAKFQDLGPPSNRIQISKKADAVVRPCATSPLPSNSVRLSPPPSRAVWRRSAPTIGFRDRESRGTSSFRPRAGVGGRTLFKAPLLQRMHGATSSDGGATWCVKSV